MCLHNCEINLSLTFSTTRYVEVFLWEKLPSDSVSPSSLFPNYLFINLFHVLKLYQMHFFFFKKVDPGCSVIRKILQEFEEITLSHLKDAILRSVKYW